MNNKELNKIVEEIRTPKDITPESHAQMIANNVEHICTNILRRFIEDNEYKKFVNKEAIESVSYQTKVNVMSSLRSLEETIHLVKNVYTGGGWTDKDQKEFEEYAERQRIEEKEFYDSLTNEEREQIAKEEAETVYEIKKEQAKAEIEEYRKNRIKPCPKCGADATNQAPNGAGIVEECSWYCTKCNWDEVTESEVM